MKFNLDIFSLVAIIVLSIIFGLSIKPLFDNIQNNYNSNIKQPEIQLINENSKSYLKINCENNYIANINPNIGLKSDSDLGAFSIEESKSGIYQISCLEPNFSSAAFTLYISKPVILKI